MSAEGTWYNELGSKVILNLDGASMRGTYQTAVGDAGGIYPLVGGIDPDGTPDETGQAIGWVVVWNNEANGSSHSITAWSGQYQIIDGREEINTLWLLTSETPEESDWAATQINKDTFTRSEPSEAEVARARCRRMPPHPA